MLKVKGPKDGRFIEASFNGKGKQLFPALKDTKNLVLLSIRDNEYCTGEYLGAVINQAINCYGFTSFLVADEIYWHNTREALDITYEEELTLRNQANDIGSDYIKKNLQFFLSPLNINMAEFNQKYKYETTSELIYTINKIAIDESKNFEILRWNDWVIKDKYFSSKKTEIMALYDTVDILKKSIDDVVFEYVDRKNKTNKSGETNLLIARSKGYLTEESPAIILIASALGYNFISYPGSILKCFQATKDYFFNDDKNEYYVNFIDKKNPKLIVNWLEIHFKKTHEQKIVANHVFIDNKCGEINQFKEINVNNNFKFTLTDNEAIEYISLMTCGVLSKIENNPDKVLLFKEYMNKWAVKFENKPLVLGVTQGILSFNMSKIEQINLLVDVLDKYRDTIIQKNKIYDKHERPSNQINFFNLKRRSVSLQTKRNEIETESLVETGFLNHK